MASYKRMLEEKIAKNTDIYYHDWHPEKPVTYLLKTTRSFENLFFEDKPKVLRHLEFFLNNEKWYEKKGLPWTLGFLLHGKPGTGKTAFIKALAKHTKRDVVSVSLKKVMTEDQLMAVFNNSTLPAHKKIIVLEEVDTMLDVLGQRQGTSNLLMNMLKTREDEDDSNSDDGAGTGSGGTRSKKTASSALSLFKNLQPITLGAFLCCIDGIVEAHGRILIMTTNHPEKLDEALLRPGRIDVKVHTKLCSVDIIDQIVCHFFDLPFGSIGIDPCGDYVMSPAEITCVCKEFMAEGYEVVVEEINRKIRERITARV